jgi:transcription-repair coupling factor (superfamily II helicase)
MEALFAAMREDSQIGRAHGCFARKQAQSFVYGLAGSQKHAVFAACCAKTPRTMVIITYSHEALEDWRQDLAALLPQVPIIELPETDLMTISAAARSIELAARRMDVLGRLIRHERIIVLANAAAAVQKSMSKQEFERLSLHMKLGDKLPRGELMERLVQLGYEHAGEIEHTGQFSTRGGIVDVFPINALVPVRLEFFDDEIDSLREFDLDTKRSLRNIGMVSVLPFAQTDKTGKPEMVLSYLEGDGVVIFDEPTRIREQIFKLVKENPELKKSIFGWEDIVIAAQENNVIYTALMLQKIHNAEPETFVSIVVKSVAPFQRQMDMMASELRGWIEQKARVLVLMGDDTKADSMRELLARYRIPSVHEKQTEALREQLVTVTKGTLLNGFELPQARLAVLAEKDILGRQKKKQVVKAAKGEKISHFRDINVGDYVVHVNHGIGKYLGVKTLEVAGVHKDYLHIKYGGDDKLFVPTDQVHLLQKYIGSEGEVPRLHRMGGTEWIKAKAKARAAVEDIARELIEIYAKRRNAQGYPFLTDTPWQQEFEDAFPYEETPDQLAAVRDIKTDMEKAEPMDRLLCGDVGFGKTEVAIRAAFKAVMSGKQVAVLVPTTVLAQQHYQTFTARFMDFGPEIDVICRFRTAKEQKETLKKVIDGQVDILIGTHAILNQRKVRFKDLGLLIVDEEQRFGVKQKEKIKKLAAGIDVLTLSATPIPRTLHMSLVGARDMSIIETPPAERFPIQTYVVENNDGILASAIRREIKRGGQIYFVYNRVETIDRMRQHIEELVPEARIQTAHGQMPEEILERVMEDFYEGKYDILLATSIVENGLDVANANTIIVYNADYFGLSQLYQMRGRVGRSSHMAFAYFVYQADKVLTETAEKRLQAIKEFAELGSGFKIAMRDLEIRGAGNLLGSQQHGHIASVGFEMYCRLLEEAVQSMKTGKPVEEIPEPVIEMQVEAYLDGEYIQDAMHKIEIYQRIAAVRKNEQLKELLDELIDRFGEPTEPVMRLLEIARIRNYARDMGVKSIVEKPMLLEISFLPKPKFEIGNFLKLKEFFGMNMKILPPPQQLVRLKIGAPQKRSIVGLVTRFLMMLAGENIEVKRPAARKSAMAATGGR